MKIIKWYFSGIGDAMRDDPENAGVICVVTLGAWSMILFVVCCLIVWTIQTILGIEGAFLPYFLGP